MIAFWHLVMDHAASYRHPLHVAGRDEDIGDRLDTAVRVPREACQIVPWYFIAKVVEKKKQIEVRGVVETEGAPLMRRCTFEGRLGPDDPLYGANGHVRFQTGSLFRFRLLRRL